MLILGMIIVLKEDDYSLYYQTTSLKIKIK
jgi:hypothetical protein